MGGSNRSALTANGEGSGKPALWGAAVRELAYQLWAFIGGREVSRVRQLLASGEHGDIGPVDVPDRTLRDWVVTHGWHDRARNDLRAIAPDLRETIAAELLAGAVDGARFIRRVNAGLDNQPDVSHILRRYDGATDDASVKALRAELDTAYKYHAAARRDRIIAAGSALDRLGISATQPLTGERAPSGGKQLSMNAGSLSDTDRDSIAALLAARLRGEDAGNDSGEGGAAAAAS